MYGALRGHPRAPRRTTTSTPTCNNTCATRQAAAFLSTSDVCTCLEPPAMPTTLPTLHSIAAEASHYSIQTLRPLRLLKIREHTT